MALNSAAMLSLGSARLLMGGLRGFAASAAGSLSSLPGSSSNSDQQDRKNHRFYDPLGRLRFNFPPHLAAAKKENESQPGAVPSLTSSRGFATSALPKAPASLSLLPLRRQHGPLSRRTAITPNAAQQVRQYTAWSAAQRYFVEGDHVVTSELHRTFQFTGLDAGSFYPFVVYTAVATAIASVFVILPYVIAPSRVDLDKSSAYECGFDAFGEARQTFSVSFYLVSIMYLLFDIEIVYMLPYVMTHASTPMFWTMNLFLGLLVVGFIYEWGVGALEWRE